MVICLKYGARMSVVKKLKEYKAEKNWTNNELARYLETSERQVVRWLNGQPPRKGWEIIIKQKIK